ncbi:MAG: hypothetical protein WEB09_02680 [Nitriliruptor sp.]
MPRPVRILLLVLLIAIAVTVLFTTIFPRVERMLEQDPTIGTVAASYEARSPS